MGANAQKDTFGVVAARYIEKECPKLARGSEFERIISRELLPKWKDLPLSEIAVAVDL